MSKNAQKYPVGQQSFAQLREKGFVYIDKTQFIEKLVNGSQYYFLGRPRRFGKSLFLSTLKCFFEGRRDLFKGLYADTMEWNWEEYPVLHLDLNTQKYSCHEELEELLESFLRENEKKYGITPSKNSLSLRFGRLIKEIYERTGREVVILVDEYDKPLVNTIHYREVFESCQDTLAAFYSNFKSSADYIQMVFLTGVSRFGKLSVFSGLNNLRDISFDSQFSEICGLTQEELQTYLKPGIETMAAKMQLSPEDMVEELKYWYDGYHFTKNSPDLYNPFSILYALSMLDFGNNWIESGTSSLLVKVLKQTDTDLSTLSDIDCSETELKGFDIDNLDPVALLYQTGYLTIKDYDAVYRMYTLGIPNFEVRQGFFEYILPYYSNLQKTSSRSLVVRLCKDLEKGLTEDFMKRLTSFFAGISYEMKLNEERGVQNALFILFSLIGLQVDVEYRTSDGRIDILIRTKSYIYIMEVKFNGSSDEALTQIKSKQYALPWAMDGRKIIGIGINYSSEKRRIEDWKSETLY